MRAGPLRERIILFEPTQTQGLAGSISKGWKEHGPYRAELKTISGAGLINAGEIFGSQRASFNLRMNIPCAEGWRVQLVGGGLFKIVSPPVRYRALGMQNITCERVNQ